MIFRFTNEEEAQLFKIADELREYVERKKSADEKMIDTAMAFSRLLLEIEQNRRKQIRTPEEILKSAKELINDCFLYEYAAYLPNCEDKAEKQIIELSDKYISEYDILDCLSWSFKYKKFKELLSKQPQEPKLLFTEKAFRKLIIQNIVSWHIGVLKGLPAAKDLEELIKDCLENSKYIYHEKEKKEYRTAAKAKEKGAITDGPQNLIIPTLPNFQYSMSLYQGKDAYLQPLSSMDNLEFKNGTLFFKGGEAVSEAELRDLRTNEGIEDIDLVSLRYYYSILFEQFQRSEYKVLQDTIEVSVPLLAGRKNPKERDIEAVLAKLKSYHNVTGVIKRIRNGKPRASLYQVLNFEKYDDKTNTVTFSSPYMNYVIQNIYDLSLRKENGKVRVTNSGKPLTLPTHSYLIDESIVRERNKAAAENVIIIVGLIEQAGSNEPHIKASTLLERNVQFAERLKATKNPRVILERTFKKTWELLETKTRLKDVYENIQLPSPNDPQFMPTMKTLDQTVFKFPHDGKKK